MFPVLVPWSKLRCGGKYESSSRMGDSEAVESMVGGGWWAPVATRGSQRGLLDEGTGSDMTACVVVVFVVVVVVVFDEDS